MNECRILIATDGSDSAVEAARLATQLPLPPVTAVDVLYVSEPRRVFAYSRSEREAVLEMLKHADRRAAEEASAAIVAIARRRWPDAAVETLLRTGLAADEILRCAQERSSHLVVVGSHGRSRLRRFVLGSVSDAVSLAAPTSVLIGRTAETPGANSESGSARQVNRPAGMQFVLAHDGSATCDAVVEELAGVPWPDGATVTVLAVLAVVSAFHMEIVQHASPEWEEEKRAARQTVERAVERLGQAGVRATGEVREADNVALAIVHCAEETSADVVILGRRPHRRLLSAQPVFGGAVAKHVVENAPGSVWSVLPHDRPPAE